MMKRRMKVYGRMRESSTASSLTKVVEEKEEEEEEEEEEEIDCEIRPGGMLVQKRSDKIDNLAPNLLLRISYGAVRYEISVNSQATFGELKKLLTVETRLQPGEQRLIFRGKERENREYLDICGVKDRSKVILMDDPTSRERRFIEMRRNAKIQTAQRAVTDVSMDIDKLADQVSAMEKSVSNGTKVPEVQITTLTEMLMRQAIKLENISLEVTDVSAQKNLQEKRVQKCVESLDVLKISNAKVKPVIVSTKWETFDPPTTTPHWEFFD